MKNIVGIPYLAARFDKDGAALNKQEVTLPEGATDPIVASHGWNNAEEQTERLYTDLFSSLAAVASDQLQNKKIAIVGVIWPSKKFTDVVEAAVAEQARGGRAGFGMSSAAADEAIRANSNSSQQRSIKKRRKRLKSRRTKSASWRVTWLPGENSGLVIMERLKMLTSL